jgi:hypothetical protein
MNDTELSHLRNAPLLFPEDRSEFLKWALGVPDDAVSAGWQPAHPRLADQAQASLLRDFGARLVALARRELNQTPDQLAASAGVEVGEVVALEHGALVAGESVERVARALCPDAPTLIQLLGLAGPLDRQLIEAAVGFIAQLGSAEPLHPAERRALERFRNAVQARA